MLRFNEETREFEDVPVRFKITGVEKTDDDYLVSIPTQYVDLFEGHDFPSLELFDRARMFANCAAEARYYKKLWLVQQNENCLKEVLAL